MQHVSFQLDEIRARIAALKADPEVQKLAAERLRIEEKIERDQQQRKVDQARALSVVGKRAESRTFETFEEESGNSKALQACRIVAADPNKGTGLWGPEGAGKTHLVTAIAHECMKRGIPAMVDSVSSILNRIRETWQHESKVSEAVMIERIASFQVLVMNDLGKERLDSWSAPTLWNLIDTRYEKGLPLIITSNSNIPKLMVRYSMPVKGVDADTLPTMFARIVEMTGKWVECNSPSRRWDHERDQEPQTPRVAPLRAVQ